MRKGWFGPKRFGYGVSPRSWQGWLATMVMVAVFAGLNLMLHRTAWGRQIVNMLVCDGAVMAVYLAVVSMTYDKDA